MRRQRRPGSRRTGTYSIDHLLSRQPKSLAKQPLYEAMMGHFRMSERLQCIRISRRCYSLLHRARIQPENLHHLYRTYRLPADPFFPLFLTVKRTYLQERERVREERRRYILETMRSLPDPVLNTIRYLGRLECHCNAAGDAPVWQKHLFPGSKRQADARTRYDSARWLAVFRAHLSLLESRYRRYPRAATDRILAGFVLDLVPDLIPPPSTDPAVVSRSYRRLSLLHHPDRGGDPALFIEIKRARDTLLGNP